MSTPRPLVVRLVDVESGQVVNEYDVTGMTGPEIQHWVEYLEATCGKSYTTEVPDWWQAA